MSILCKILGHKQPQPELLKPLGWIRHWSQFFDHHRIGYRCERCSKNVDLGFIATNKEGKIDYD